MAVPRARGRPPPARAIAVCSTVATGAGAPRGWPRRLSQLEMMGAGPTTITSAYGHPSSADALPTPHRE